MKRVFEFWFNRKKFNLTAKAIKKVNNEVNQPCTVNIGRHLMNSDTQDYIQKMLLDAGYTVIRTTDGLARYSVLKVTWGKRV